jgi:hypothetical protein
VVGSRGCAARPEVQLPDMTASSLYPRFRPDPFVVATVAALIALTSGRAHAQSMRGEVRDLATGAPVARAAVMVMNGRDSLLRQVLANDSGKFVFHMPDPGEYALQFKRIGWQPVTTTVFKLNKGDTLSITIDMARNAVSLDTMIAKETRGVFEMTKGQEFVRQHFLLNTGMIISGLEIEKSKLLLSEFLGRQAGVKLVPTWDVRQPVVPGQGRRVLMADATGGGCLYARIDRGSLLFKLMSEAAGWVDDAVKTKDVMAVEVYLDRSDVPKEWQFDARPEVMYSRNFMGRGNTRTSTRSGLPPGDLIIGDTGVPKLTGEMVTEDAASFGTVAINADGLPPACGFLQIWTGAAW